MGSQAESEIADEKSELPVIHGMPWVQGITQEMVDTFSRLAATEDEIYIVSYPKSGTTWTQEIVWQILNGGKIDYRRLDIRMPWIEGMVILPIDENPYHVTTPSMIERMFESFPAPRVFKCHLPYDLVPKGRDEVTKPRYIYVMRNPKDTAVSYYQHCAILERDELPYTSAWDEFIENFAKGKVYFGSWFDHVMSWWEQRDDPNILFLKYEDMKKDSLGAIRQIAQFIGKDVSPETLARIVEQTSFSAMKQGRSANYSWIKKLTGDFIRKGQVGNWKAHFTKQQSEFIDKLYAKKMAGTGLEFEYGENKN